MPKKKEFYSRLNREYITDVNYSHTKKVYKEFKNKNLGDYHDLYVQSDTLILADVFEDFRNIRLKLYEVNPAHMLSAPELAWELALKKTGQKVELLTDIDMLLMVKKKELEEEYVIKYVDIQNQIINI